MKEEKIKPWFEDKSNKYKKKYHDEELEKTIKEKKKKSFFKKALTPENVEEIKPNFFIQKKGDSYRQVHPLVWKGKWRLKNQIKIRNILMIILIVALYFAAVKYIRFYEEVNADPQAFCKNISAINIGEVKYENTSTIPTNFEKDEWDLS